MCSADRQKPRAMGPPRAIADGEGDNYLYLHLFTQLNPPKPRQDSAAPRAVRHPTLDQHTGQGRVDAKPGDYSDEPFEPFETLVATTHQSPSRTPQCNRTHRASLGLRA